MLTRMDDYLIHQTIDTIDHVATGDPRFQDRGLFFVYDKAGTVQFEVGFGVYPNQNMIDAWICAVHQDRQFNLRVARPLMGDRSDLHIGPLQIDIVEPMKSWRVRILPNDYGLECDLEFAARAEAFEFAPVFVRRNNHVEHHQMHLQQSGTYSGWISVGGKRFDGPFIGARDRSWGVRGARVGEAFDRKAHSTVTPFNADASSEDQSLLAWISAEFPGHALHAWFMRDRDGNTTYADAANVAAGGEVSARFTSWGKPQIEFGPEGYPVSMVLPLITDEGETHHFGIRPLISRSPEGNGYYKGFYGRQRPDLHIEGENWDLSDPDFRRDFGYMNGTMLAEFTVGEDVGLGIIITSAFERHK